MVLTLMMTLQTYFKGVTMVKTYTLEELIENTFEVYRMVNTEKTRKEIRELLNYLLFIKATR